MMFNGSTTLLLLLVSGSSVDAFAPSKLASIQSTVSRLRSTTLEPNKVNGAAELTTWECDEDVQCVEVPACDEEVCRTSLDVRIHGDWYDLTGQSVALFLSFKTCSWMEFVGRLLEPLSESLSWHPK
jgi:hypothetical protein